MALPVTETVHPDAEGLDTLPPEAILRRLLAGQERALAALAPALPDLAQGARIMSGCLRAGGRLAYAGAGSSGLMAMADAMELAGTFGLDPARVLLFMAGGLPQGPALPGGPEDDAAGGAGLGGTLRAGDAAVVVAASGRTAWAVGFARAARTAGARVIALANNAGTPLLAEADVPVLLATPPEVIAGSTRMGAGTAQKAALNLMSTLMGVHLGAIHDGRMVGLRADNAKLRARAEAIVAAIAGTGDAARALALAAGAVKPAVLIARGLDPAEADAVLSGADGNLRAALDGLAPEDGHKKIAIQQGGRP